MHEHPKNKNKKKGEKEHKNSSPKNHYPFRAYDLLHFPISIFFLPLTSLLFLIQILWYASINSKPVRSSFLKNCLLIFWRMNTLWRNMKRTSKRNLDQPVHRHPTSSPIFSSSKEPHYIEYCRRERGIIGWLYGFIEREGENDMVWVSEILVFI